MERSNNNGMNNKNKQDSFKQEINLSESDNDDNGGFNDASFDDDLGSDREVGLNLGEALRDNDFKNKNIF